jgi:hypothetical protein
MTSRGVVAMSEGAARSEFLQLFCYSTLVAWIGTEFISVHNIMQMSKLTGDFTLTVLQMGVTLRQMMTMTREGVVKRRLMMKKNFLIQRSHLRVHHLLSNKLQTEKLIWS